MKKIALVTCSFFLLCLYLRRSDATFGYTESFHSWCNPTTCLQFPKICPCPGSDELSNKKSDPCDNNTINNCTVYSFSINGAVSRSCGECGMLGSKCSVNNVTCQPPGYCYDSYCHCPTGNPFYGICVHYQPIANSELTIALIVTLIALVILLRLISSHKFIRRRCCLPITTRYHRWRGRSGILDTAETICGHNPESGTKSAAYTIATREFMTTSTDPDLEWALELSMQIETTHTSTDVQNSLSAEASPSSGASEERILMETPGSSGEPRRQPALLRSRRQQLTSSNSTLSSSSSSSSDYWSLTENPEADVTTSGTTVLENYTNGFMTDSLKRNLPRAEIIMTRILEDSTCTFPPPTTTDLSNSQGSV